jgi:hypothetical protein
VAIANSGAHTHDLGASTTGTGNIPNDGGQGVTGSTAAATAAVSGTTDAASNLPPFGDVLYCMKN